MQNYTFVVLMCAQVFCFCHMRERNILPLHTTPHFSANASDLSLNYSHIRGIGLLFECHNLKYNFTFKKNIAHKLYVVRSSLYDHKIIYILFKHENYITLKSSKYSELQTHIIYVCQPFSTVGYNHVVL